MSNFEWAIFGSLLVIVLALACIADSLNTIAKAIRDRP